MADPVSDSPMRWVAPAVVAWLVPGGGHLLLGRRRRGGFFLAVLGLMFAIGLLLDGKL